MYDLSRKIYEAVPNIEDEETEAASGTDQNQKRIPRRHCLSLMLGWAVAITLALTVTIGAAMYHTSRPNTPLPPIWSDCGGTPEEARRRGCHFDILSFAWQTPECYDHENTEAFRTHNGSWTYYTAHHGTETRSEEEAMTGEYRTFVTAQYHFTHCTYMWRQMHRAYSLRGYIDDHVGSWNHTLHCQKVLLAGPSMHRSNVNTVGDIRYPRCVKIW